MNEERSTISFRDTWTAGQEFSFGEVDGKPKGRSNIIKYRQSHLSTFTSWRDKCRIICKLQKRPHIPFQRFDVETHSQACHTATSDSPWYVTSDSIRRCPELVTQGSKDHNGSGMWPEVAKYPRGGQRPPPWIEITKKSTRKWRGPKTLTIPQNTQGHTHTLLQSYQWWSIACRLSEVKVISGWLIYRRCSFCAGFTSCTWQSKRNSECFITYSPLIPIHCYPVLYTTNGLDALTSIVCLT